MKIFIPLVLFIAMVSAFLFYRGTNRHETLSQEEQPAKKNTSDISKARSETTQGTTQEPPSISKPNAANLVERESKESLKYPVKPMDQRSKESPTQPSSQEVTVPALQEEVSGFLTKVEISDFKKMLHSLAIVTTDDFLRMFRGNFEGTAEIKSPTAYSTKMGLQMAIEIVNQKQQGRIYIEIAKPGDDLHYNLPLRITELQQAPDDSNGLFLTAIDGSSNTTYFHIYYSPQLDSVIGNVYREAGGRIQRVGTFSLRRV
jgi:hypothetical protein